MNRLEARSKFRDRLQKRNPILAGRYLAYIKEKRVAKTSEYAYHDLVFRETKSRVASLLVDNGYNGDLDEPGEFDYHCGAIASDWICYNRSKSKGFSDMVDSVSTDIDLLEKIGINPLEDFVKGFVDYRRTIDSTAFPFEFKKHLLKSVKIGDRGLTEDDILVAEVLLFNQGNHRVQVETRHGVCNFYRNPEYYRKQYRRLERERKLHTREAEDIFIPLLKAIQTPDGAVSKTVDILGKTGAYCVPMALAEIREAVGKWGSLDLKTAVSSSTVPDDTMFCFLDTDEFLYVVPIGDLRTVVNEYFVSPIDPDLHGDLISSIYNFSVQVDIDELEKRTKMAVTASEDAAMDLSPEDARWLRESTILHRFTHYLFNLARRRANDLSPPTRER